MRYNERATEHAVSVMVDTCHEAAKHWWIDPKTGADTRDNPMCFSQKLMLIVSERCTGLLAGRTLRRALQQ
jgi:hypothetical protein